MLLNFVLRLIAASSIAGSTTQSVTPVKSDEILTYECARTVSTMVETSQQTGPVFSEGLLVFTSIETQGGGKVLIISAGGGTYAIELKHEGVNRLRFELASQESFKPKKFFLTYVHDRIFRSRYFDFSMNRPPLGRDDLDYDLVQARRAEYMLPHLEYAIYETSENALLAITEGRVKRDQMNRHKAENCEHISRKTPGLARNLRHNLDVLELIVMGPPAPKSRIQGTSRMPASVKKN